MIDCLFSGGEKVQRCSSLVCLISLGFWSIGFLESGFGFGAISYHKSMLRLNSSISFVREIFVILLPSKKVGVWGRRGVVLCVSHRHLRIWIGAYCHSFWVMLANLLSIFLETVVYISGNNAFNLFCKHDMLLYFKFTGQKITISLYYITYADLKVFILQSSVRSTNRS